VFKGVNHQVDMKERAQR